MGRLTCDVYAVAGWFCSRRELVEDVVVSAAEESVLAQRELVTRDELPGARLTAEAVQVVDVLPRAHHEVRAAEAQLALGAFGAEQPACTLQEGTRC